MLDNETKRRIDTARDILVGKVPDPKSQVEQITIALVYKFMDDMDKESVEMGGKASFFTGDYERYAWSKIFDPRIGGHEMLGLYGEAIVKLNQNPNIPQLFRDIFKNAYLPYRDPETLKLFLKTINEFSYDHSERLGDAFEYLLSVLGSQGDAGQFRTPRHIIDFMVQVVNPQKHETVLDPACGTAGFLISSYKHILKGNCKKVPGDSLNTEERKKLLTNFKGYDISPDMVRLSLVNMYLHGFVQPQIMEYDTPWIPVDSLRGRRFNIETAIDVFLLLEDFAHPHPLSRGFKTLDHVQLVQEFLKGVFLEQTGVLHSLLDGGKEDQRNKGHEELSVQALLGRDQGPAKVQPFLQVSKCFFHQVFVSVGFQGWNCLQRFIGKKTKEPAVFLGPLYRGFFHNRLCPPLGSGFHFEVLRIHRFMFRYGITALQFSFEPDEGFIQSFLFFSRLIRIVVIVDVQPSICFQSILFVRTFLAIRPWNPDGMVVELVSIIIMLEGSKAIIEAF